MSRGEKLLSKVQVRLADKSANTSISSCHSLITKVPLYHIVLALWIFQVLVNGNSNTLMKENTFPVAENTSYGSGTKDPSFSVALQQQQQPSFPLPFLFSYVSLNFICSRHFFFLCHNLPCCFLYIFPQQPKL